MPASRRTNRANGGLDADRAAFCTELLAADKRARQAGTPLLTRFGHHYVAGLLVAARAGIAAQLTPRDAAAKEPSRPRWDALRRRLFLGAVLLKEFRQPAPDQTAVLDAFQRRQWSTQYLTNLLAPERGAGRKKDRRRLMDTVKNLNRGLPAGTIRLRSKGGLGVWWEHAERSLGDGHSGTRQRALTFGSWFRWRSNVATGTTAPQHPPVVLLNRRVADPGPYYTCTRDTVWSAELQRSLSAEYL